MPVLGELVVEYRGDVEGLVRAAREAQEALDRTGEEAEKTGEKVEDIGHAARATEAQAKDSGSSVSSVLGDWRVQALAAAASVLKIVDAIAELDQRTQQLGPLADLLGVDVQGAQVLEALAQSAGIEGGALELSELTAQLSEYALLVTAQQDEAAAVPPAPEPVSRWDTPFARSRAAGSRTIRNRLGALVGREQPPPEPEIDEGTASDITDYAAAFERLGLDPRLVSELTGIERIDYLQQTLAAQRLERPGSYAFDLSIIAGDAGARGLAGLARTPVTPLRAFQDLHRTGRLATELDIDRAEEANYQRAIGAEHRQNLARDAFDQLALGLRDVGELLYETEGVTLPSGQRILNPIRELGLGIRNAPILGELARYAVAPFESRLDQIEISIDPAAAAAGVQARTRDGIHDGTVAVGLGHGARSAIP